MNMFVYYPKQWKLDFGFARYCTLAVLKVSIILTLIAHISYALPTADYPLKLRLESDRQTFPMGESATFTLRLLGHSDTQATAPSDLLIPVVTTTPSGGKDLSEISIKKGAGSALIHISVKEQGIYETRTESDVLLNSGLIYSSITPQMPKPEGENTRDVTDSLNLDMLLSQSRSGSSQPALSGGTPNPDQALEVVLRAFPKEPRLADGKDTATIFAYLLNKNAIARENIQIILHSREGNLDPNVLLIKKGSFRGHATLTSQQPGRIAVEYMNSNPPLRITGTPIVEVDFRPPVIAIGVAASPKRISMFEDAHLIVSMLDHNGELITEDKDRTVFFSITEGQGRLDSQSIAIAKGAAQAAIKFSPTTSGTVTIQAKTPNLFMAESAAITVTWPWLIFGLAIVGALSGGTLAWVLKKETNWWLIPASLVFGFIIYWAFLFGLIKVLPKHLILNPYSAFVIAVIGGWMGPKALDFVLKRLGFSAG